MADKEDLLNEEFLKGLLGNEEISVDDKIKEILKQHTADVRGLVDKKNELLDHEKKFKEQIASLTSEQESAKGKLTGLEEELKKATSEDHKKYYETQLADLNAKHQDELKKVSEERDFYKQSHLTALRNKDIEKGIKDINFIDGLKDGFIARVLSMNDFEPQNIDGETKFLNKDHHTIEEVITSFALTQEGKSYIRNPSTGGGAVGSNSNTTTSNAKTMTRAQYDDMAKSNPQGVAEFFRNGGSIKE